jgi:hypothetical protein
MQWPREKEKTSKDLQNTTQKNKDLATNLNHPTIIYKTYNHLSPQIIEQKKRPQHIWS